MRQNPNQKHENISDLVTYTEHSKWNVLYVLLVTPVLWSKIWYGVTRQI